MENNSVVDGKGFLVQPIEESEGATGHLSHIVTV